MHTLLVSLTVFWMRLLQPQAPWIDTYEATAEIFVTNAEQAPLYKNIKETLAVEVSLSWFESRFNPKAKGDGGASHGIFQIAPGTAKPYALRHRAHRVALGEIFDPWQDDLLAVETATPIALDLIHESFKICRGRPWYESLGWYAAGGAGCRGIKESHHRMGKAQWLLRHGIPDESAVQPDAVALKD